MQLDNSIAEHVDDPVHLYGVQLHYGNAERRDGMYTTTSLLYTARF
jgi:hypothetical protein